MTQPDKLRSLANRLERRAASNTFADGFGSDLFAAVAYLRELAATEDAKLERIRNCGTTPSHPGVPATVAG